MFCENFSNSGIDIIAVSETFYKDGSLTSLPGYNLFNVNRTDINGGGVALYVTDKLNAKLLAYSNGLSTEPEYVIIEVKSASMSLLVSCVYRRPKNGYLDNFLNELYLHLPKYKYSFICGDFNARFGSGSFETAIIEEMFELCSHTIIPFGSTYHINECHSALDLIASNMDDLLIEYGKTAAPCFSHHDLLYAVFKLNVPCHKAKVITYRDYKHLNLEHLMEDVSNTSWKEVHGCDNIDDKVNRFNDILLNVLNIHAPIKQVKAKHYSAPWFNNDIRASLKARNKARKRYIKSSSPIDFAVYREVRNKTKQMIKNAKIKFFHGIFNSSTNAEVIWKNIKSLGIGKSNDGITTDLPITANELNEHYASVSTIENYELACDTEKYYEGRPSNPGESFHFKYVTSDVIITAVNSIKSSAIGFDNIPIKFLKLILCKVVYVLEYIFNFSLQHGAFPTVWKSANILPVSKVKNPLTCKDFRPISILCALGKVFEKIVHTQIYDYAISNNLLDPLQSGFRKKHSAISALIKITDDLRRSIDNRKLSILVLLDYSKAFDRVNHRLLLIKLKKLGFSDSVILWLQSYLCDRLQRVFKDDSFVSDWTAVTAGVPQGSVLGPLLFILYLHDISTVLKYCHYHLYADDTQIYIDFDINNIEDAVARINDDLDRLIIYLARHNVALNAAKTQCLIIGSDKYLKSLTLCDIPQISISNVLVPYCDKLTNPNLGVIFDSTLSWKPHSINVIRKVFSILAQVRRNFCFLPRTIRLRLVKCLIMPIIDYGSSLFTDMCKDTCAKLQRAENACIRFIVNASRFDHITPHYAELNLLKILDRRSLNICSLMWNIHKYKCPSYLFEMFSTLSSVNSRPSRSSPDMLVIPVHRTVAYDKSFCVTASRLYNLYKIYSYLHMSTPNSLKQYVKTCLLSAYKL
jgi:hypothetical protein